MAFLVQINSIFDPDPKAAFYVYSRFDGENHAGFKISPGLLLDTEVLMRAGADAVAKAVDEIFSITFFGDIVAGDGVEGFEFNRLTSEESFDHLGGVFKNFFLCGLDNPVDFLPFGFGLAHKNCPR